MNWLTKRNDRQDSPRIGSISVNLQVDAGELPVGLRERRIDPSVMYDVALPRILNFFDALQVRATFFVVGKEIEDPSTHAVLKEILARGHEIASMSYAHAPNLRMWSKLSVAEDIEQSGRAIKNATGVMPVGFRTPGFNVDTRILQLLSERGYAYDASVLPSLPYYLLKGGISSIGAFIRGKRDSSTLAVHSLKAPLHPYRPSRWAFWKPGDRKHSLPLWEIPAGVVRGIGAPLTGSLITSTQPALIRPLARALNARKHNAHLTLHATDFLDASDLPPSGAFARMRTNMQQSHPSKMRRLRMYIEEMKRDARVLPLKELTEILDEQAGPTVLG